MNTSEMPSSPPNAEALYLRLREELRAVVNASAAPVSLVGITTGGAWIAERLHRELAIITPLGIVSSALHRDDFATRGMSNAAQTDLPFDVNDADIVLIDDVLHTGRTIRAVINELYDFGRPRRIRLAVLVDRGERELPIQADYVGARLTPGSITARRLTLQKSAQSGEFCF